MSEQCHSEPLLVAHAVNKGCFIIAQSQHPNYATYQSKRILGVVFLASKDSNPLRRRRTQDEQDEISSFENRSPANRLKYCNDGDLRGPLPLLNVSESQLGQVLSILGDQTLTNPSDSTYSMEVSLQTDNSASTWRGMFHILLSENQRENVRFIQFWDASRVVERPLEVFPWISKESLQKQKLSGIVTAGKFPPKA